MTIEHLRVCLAKYPEEDGIIFKLDKTDKNGNSYYHVLWNDGFSSGRFLESEWPGIVSSNKWVECELLDEKQLLVWILKNPDYALAEDIGELD